MSTRTTPCNEAIRRGRLDKAVQFLAAARLVQDDDHRDAAAMLLVQAGIAAADVLCCLRLGHHARGESHHEAVSLLSQVSRSHARDLKRLLELKHHTSYTAQTIPHARLTSALRAAERLVEAARTAR